MKAKGWLTIMCMMGLVGCSSAHWSNDDALMARSIEMQVDEGGSLTEIEYKIDPMKTPAAVRAAMDRLHPGGPFTDAEKEWNEGQLYFELSRVVGGMEVEAMFTPEGKLHSEEVQVTAAKVPAAVKSAIQSRWPRATVKKWEEIRDSERMVREYHVKLRQGDRHLKVAVSTAGVVRAAWREMPAEIEVPLGDG